MEKPYVIKDQKKLRCGYTTGTCAAAAAKAAAMMLLGCGHASYVTVTTPKGILAGFCVEDAVKDPEFVSCSVRKDAGDDPDVTHGMKIFAKVKRTKEQRIQIDGGIGVGRVTKKGLSCPVGSAAINPVPRAMIEREVKDVCNKLGYGNGLDVEVFIPDGESIAKRTFNPRLGIEGGLSILGTSGIVEPMSESAMVDSICLEMNMMHANGIKTIVFTPGNYGGDFIKKQSDIPENAVLRCSNFIGEGLDHAADLKLDGVLLIGHAGKLVKLAGGIMNTHSKYADCRMEIFASYAAASGAGKAIVEELLGCITADHALDILEKSGLLVKTMRRITERIEYHLSARLNGLVLSGALLFSNVYGVLGQTSRVPELIEHIKTAGGKT